MTADIQSATRDLVLQAGSLGLVNKPIKHEEFLDLVTSALAERQS